MALTTIVSKFSFYQQIRIMLRHLRRKGGSDPALLNENLRIISTLSLDAPDGQIESVSQDAPDMPLQVTAWHNGITGAMGALPTVYSEWMIERHYRYSDHSAKAFIDLFGHRLYCLDFLAWQKSRFYAQAESREPLSLQTAVLAISGQLTDAPADQSLHYAHIFASPVRSMVDLERWLAQVYCVPVRVIPFTGGWRTVAEHERCQIGNPQQTLATAPMVGGVRLEIHAHFDVVLGPVTPEESRRFTPQGSEWKNIWSLIRNYVGSAIDFSVSLSISTTDLHLRPLGMSVLGLDLCLGHNSSTPLHQVRLPAPPL
ncbi:type VI secretion system baseplate subunit TssG [Enterobacter mori]|uniref:type VI secretion system baseplate subunit TssG n=1 Tax=Enterobacter mori TaxID=539813 RepID=UPI003B8438E7